MVLGLIDLSLGGSLIKVPTFFKKELFVVFLAGGLVRYNVSFNLATVMICAVAFGTLVRHVPYQQHKYCKDYYCGSLDSHSVLLINSLMGVLVTCFLMQALDLEARPCGTSATAEPLCPLGDPSYAEPIRISGPFTQDYPEPNRTAGPFTQDFPEAIRATGPFIQDYPEPIRITRPFNQNYPEPISTTRPFNQNYPEPIRTTRPFNQDYPEPIRMTGP
ncbi:hypothetical protein NHX12_001861 [Muraenolepis orangiensis]|uniref:Uncharacterized protein n=1 Tax=Muraenolepis orangiensis TaxID=630683 RepID=A0A9Q0E2X9_9TELE|nr:hypothetical protein NHX12_001861 [Muraenolepis orangiensis]